MYESMINHLVFLILHNLMVFLWILVSKILFFFCLSSKSSIFKNNLFPIFYRGSTLPFDWLEGSLFEIFIFTIIELKTWGHFVV